MPQKRRLCGVVFLSPAYHDSIDCPSIKRMLRTGGKYGRAELRQYESEREAVLTGHTSRCRFCLGRRVVDIDGTKERVYMSVAQYETLQAVVEIFNKKGAMKLHDIAVLRKRTTVAVYLMVKRLRRDGYVEHKLKMGGKRASGRSIVPTQKGIAVAKSISMEEGISLK